MKPKIKEAAFGSITVGKRTYEHDIVIGLGRKVRKRKKKLSKRHFGTSHRVSLDEIKDVYEKGTRQLIVGTGHYDRVRLSEEAATYLGARGCAVILLSTPQALVQWNESKTKDKTIGLFHVTC